LKILFDIDNSRGAGGDGGGVGGVGV